MPDDRSSGFSGGSGFVRFSSADNSGSISRIPDKKRSRNQQQEPDNQEKDTEKREEFKESEYVDRSAQLSASLNSLAMLNVASVNKDRLKSKILKNAETKEIVKPD